MNQHLKQRLVGATVLVVFGIIVLPMILDRPASFESEPDITNIRLTPPTEVKESVKTRTIPEEVIARYELPENKKSQNFPMATQKKEKPVQKPRVVKSGEEKISTRDLKPNKPLDTIKGNQQWAVQMGSFSSKENADRLVQRLKTQKNLAYSEDIETNGKVVYRVRVGPFDSKSKTEEMKKKLDQKEKLKTLIVTLH